MKAQRLIPLGIAMAVSIMGLSLNVQAGTGYVTGDLLNVRETMSTESEIVDVLEYGDEVLITYGPEDGWCEIYHQGDCYYVASEFISVDGDDTAEQSEEEYDGEESYQEDFTAEESEASGSNGTYLGTFTLTAYCNCAQCCGTAGNYTASGTWPTAGRTVAMEGVPFGTQLLINGHVYTVEDRGTPYGHVDIFHNSHAEALSFGLQYADVYQLN